MEDIFRDVDFVNLYIDDLLVFSVDMNMHKIHLQKVYDRIYKHGIALSKKKMEFAKTKIEYLSLILFLGKIEMQEHVLKALSQFPDKILAKKQLQRFLGSLNYIRSFYENQAKDVKSLQKQLKIELPWNEKMTKVVQIIKQKIKNLLRLHYPFILETNALEYVWESVLLQKHSNREQMCMYASRCFKEPKLKYPSSHKEIMATKNGIKRFRLFLKHVHFIVREKLKHMKGMLSNHIFLEQGNNKVLRWSSWLDGHDFDIEYKPGKYNCIVDLLTREAHRAKHQTKDTNMFTICIGSSNRPPHPTPEGFHWVLVCKSCTVCLCFDCITRIVKFSPCYEHILHHWANRGNNSE
jgi:hypothetical protein